MKKVVIVLTAGLFCLGTIGCGPPSPEAVCTKAMETVKAEAAKKATQGGMAALGAGLASVALDAAKPACVAQLTAAKQASPETYKRVSTCIMGAKEIADFGKCAVAAIAK